jgi:sugar lactone lactonase YvrE
MSIHLCVYSLPSDAIAYTRHHSIGMLNVLASDKSPVASILFVVLLSLSLISMSFNLNLSINEDDTNLAFAQNGTQDQANSPISNTTKNAQNYDRILKFNVANNSNGTFATSFGPNGTELGAFIHIHGIATDSQGNVYAVDEAKRQIQKFDSNGTFITAWGGATEPTTFLSSKLEDVDVDLQDNVYVVDYGRHAIYKYDSNGTFLTSLGTNGTSVGTFSRPWGITVDSKGSIYVTDRDNHRVQKFDSGGGFVTSWGMNGTAPGRFVWPEGISVDSLDNVYVVDEKNSNVQKFDSNGTFITSWGSEGTGEGQFKEPHGIDVDISGDDDIVYVVDTGNQRVQVFTNEGNYITSFGSKGIGPGQFLFPQDISVDSSRGSIFVSDQKLQHPEKYVIRTFIRESSVLNFTSDNAKASQSDITNSSAFPILIPGNNLPNQVQFDSENNDDLDAFGLRKLYPTELGGREWVAKWDNGHPRTILDQGVDPCDPELHITHTSNQEIGFKGYLEIGGDGTARVSAHSGRLYIYFDEFENKTKWGPSIEMTTYFKFVNKSELSSQHFVGLKGPTNHFADSINNSNGRNYGMDFMLDDGRGIRAAKEVVHGVYNAEEKRRIFPDDKFPHDKWVGLKFVLRELKHSANDDKNIMKLEAYIDLTNGKDGGDWRKVHEFVDNGSWADYDAEEKDLLSSIIKEGDHGVLDHPIKDPNQVWNTDAFAVALRLDGVVTGYLKNFSVRTIVPN